MPKKKNEIRKMTRAEWISMKFAEVVKRRKKEVEDRENQNNST